MNNNDEEDVWTIVKTKKKVKQQCKSNNNDNIINNSNRKKKINQSHRLNHINNYNDDANDNIESYDNIIKVINTTLLLLKETKYYIQILAAIKDTLVIKNSNNNVNYVINEILSLGIGSFSKSSSSLLQLVMALSLSEDLSNNDNDKINCVIFDPIFNDVELSVCSSLGINVSKENKFGKHNASNDNNITLFFMPHCPYRLYCNLLWQNWYNLSNMIMYGNSISSYSLRRINDEKIDVTNCVVCMESFIIEKSLKLDKGNNNQIIPRELHHFENAFNDLRYRFLTLFNFTNNNLISL